MIEKFADLLAEMTKNSIASIHIDAIGLIRLAENNSDRLSSFKNMLIDVEAKGGNVIIPTYSYSYTKREVYDIKNTSSDVGIVTEYLRENTINKRTVDPLFSYLVFGNSVSGKHKVIQDYESFGDDSLIGELFKKKGYVCSVGALFRNSATEIHYLERLLDVSYRKNKNFNGEIIDLEGNIKDQCVTFYCRKLEMGLESSFARLEKDLKDEGLLKKITIDRLNFEMKYIQIIELFEFIQEKIKDDYLYLCVKE